MFIKSTAIDEFEALLKDVAFFCPDEEDCTILYHTRLSIYLLDRQTSLSFTFPKSFFDFLPFKPA